MPGSGAVVQTITGRRHGASPLPLSLPAPPAAGNLVVAVLGKDKALGTATAPAGFTLRGSYVGLSTGAALADAVADQGGDWAWTGATGAGAVGALVELDMSSATFTGASQFPSPANDTSVTSIAGTLGAAPSAGVVFAVVSIDTTYDSPGTHAWAVGQTITHTGWERVLGPVQAAAANAATDAGGCGIIVLRRTVAAGAATDLTMTWTGSADQAGLVMAHYAWTGSSSGTLTSSWIGVDTISARIAGGSGDARIAFSTSSAMTNPVYTASVTPDALGNIRAPIPAGMGADTVHFYQVEHAGTLIGTAREFRTLPASGSFSFGFSSCRNHTGDSAILSDVFTRGCDLFIQTGDIHYNNFTTNSLPNFRGAYDELHTRTNIGNVLTRVPNVYTWSDHDFGGDNSDSTSPARPAAQAVYRERVPHTSLPHAEGIYHTFTVARTRFIVLDTRSFRSPSANTDDSAKTMLGAAQKTWLQNLLATSDSLLTFIVSAEGWVASTAADDHWGSYQTERAQIAGWIVASSTKVVFLCGDAHMLAFDDGTNAAGGVHVWHAAALNQTGTTKGGPYSGGTLAGSNQYGYVEVLDVGSDVTATYRGIKSDATVWNTDVVTATDLRRTHAFLSVL